MSQRPNQIVDALLLWKRVGAIFLVLALSLFASKAETALATIGGELVDIQPESSPTTTNAEITLTVEIFPGTSEPNVMEAPPEPAALELPNPEVSAPAHPADHCGILNAARRYALGMIETGNNDKAVGGLGEVSRYQIMPSVWKSYSSVQRYREPEAATEVAQQHWTALYEYFKSKAGREPTNFDMYVLWNTKYGYYAGKGFTPDRLSPVVRDRAQRFTNLVEDSIRRDSDLAMTTGR